MKQIALGYIFPVLIMNSGCVQSAIQHLFYACIIYGARKTILRLEVAEDTHIVVDKYENKMMCEPLSFTYRCVCALYKLIYSLLGFLGMCTKIKQQGPPTINKLPEMNIVLVHGLNGSSDSKYVIGMANLFLRKNCRVFCINSRGEKGVFTGMTFTHFGFTEDILFLTKHILETYEGKVFFVGFSQGGNMVTKFMAEFKHERVLGGVSVCNPFNFTKLEEVHKKGTWINRVVGRRVCDQFRDHLEKVYRQKFNGRDFREIINQLIQEGFLKYGSVEEYQKAASSEDCIHLVDKPLLFINADDDPVIPIEVVPKEKIFKNRNTGLITLQGGHLGFRSFFLTSTIEGLIDDFYRNLEK
ncbi:ABHD [Enterospora canceri]|uniref:ABHD n=1 Tax=Enterospora canceri TaxID=1081671 RepID=A0A1Y1S549_9MICR|nr:ABHD [Enterospora canceri]